MFFDILSLVNIGLAVFAGALVWRSALTKTNGKRRLRMFTLIVMGIVALAYCGALAVWRTGLPVYVARPLFTALIVTILGWVFVEA